MLISTADSYLNTAAVLFAHDLVKPMGLARSEKTELLTKEKMITTPMLTKLLANKSVANSFLGFCKSLEIKFYYNRFVITKFCPIFIIYNFNIF